MSAMTIKRKSWPDRLKISIMVDGELVEVGRRYRGKDGKLRVAWTVPYSRIKDEILYLERDRRRE